MTRRVLLVALVGGAALALCLRLTAHSTPDPLCSASLCARFAPEGVTIGDWRFSYDGPAAPATSTATRVSFAHSDGVTEWYEARPAGIEQGFTVARKPAAELRVRLLVQGPSSVHRSGDGLRLGELRYDQLEVRDAMGHDVPGRVQWAAPGQRACPREVRGCVDLVVASAAMADAPFPLVLDPLVSVPVWTVAGAVQIDAGFGSAVAGLGDINGDGFNDIGVGAPGFTGEAPGEGRVAVYFGKASGLGLLADVLLDPTNQTNAGFGSSVSAAGDVNGDGFADVIVGAPDWDGQAVNEGRAYLFLGSATGLGGVFQTFDPSDQADARFGASVVGIGDLNGDGYDDVAIGAPGFDAQAVDEGRVYVYLGGPTGLDADPSNTLDPTDLTGANYGASLASAGDVNADGYADLVVGAPCSASTPISAGKAYVHGGDSLTQLTTLAVLSGEVPGDLFGASVSGAGDLNGDGFAEVIVGAPGFDNQAPDEGRAYVFNGTVGGTKTNALWRLDPTDSASAHFGGAVSSAGDVNGDGYADVVIGAELADGDMNQEGRIFVYLGSVNGLVTTTGTALDASNAVRSLFGSAVAEAGDVNGDGLADVLVGAKAFTPAMLSQAGVAYVFDGVALGPSSTPSWEVDPADQTGALFGWEVARAGDVNGDGFDDVLVGANYFAAEANHEGRAFLFLGHANGLSSTPDWFLDPTNQDGAEFGFAMNGVGDVNGDGYADVIIGAHGWSGAFQFQGRAYVYLGSASGLSTTASATFEPAAELNANFGLTVVPLGDVNGDGFADVAIGGYGGALGGRVFVYHGSATGLTQVLALDCGQGGALFGQGLRGVGDLNGDGFADLMVGAPNWTDGTRNEGRAFVYLGSPTGLSATPSWVSDPTDQDGALYGRFIAALGDVNGDGFADLAVGAPGWSAEAVNEGRAYIYLGAAGGLQPPLLFDPTDTANAQFGLSMAGADVNGDGFSDVVISAPRFDTSPGNQQGKAWVYPGGKTGMRTTPMLVLQPINQNAASFGGSTALAGDVNGDGFDDLVFGVLGCNCSLPNEGAAMAFYGGDQAPGLNRRLNQSTVFPVVRELVPGGRPLPVASNVVFAARATQEGGAGSRVAVQFEVKPVGTAFNGKGLVYDTAHEPPGPSNSVIISGLAGGGYHWRARVIKPSTFGAGRWVSYGGNQETEADFSVLSPPDAGSAFDAGAVADAGVAADAGPSGDAGVAPVDAGAGVVDAGAAGDAGGAAPGDAGAPQGGPDASVVADGGVPATQTYIVGCGCDSTDGAGVFLLAALGVMRRSRRRD